MVREYEHGLTIHWNQNSESADLKIERMEQRKQDRTTIELTKNRLEELGWIVNNEGEVIGINTIRTGSDGIGFAININNSLDSAKKLIALGDPPPPGYLGISFDEITPALAFLFDLPTNHLWITYINPGSPAEVSGLKIDDIIISMNDSKIQNGANLTEFLRTHQAGNKINITLLRDRSYLLETEVILGERPN